VAYALAATGMATTSRSDVEVALSNTPSIRG
jgi:hypothetical protein